MPICNLIKQVVSASARTVKCGRKSAPSDTKLVPSDAKTVFSHAEHPAEGETYAGEMEEAKEDLHLGDISPRSFSTTVFSPTSFSPTSFFVDQPLGDDPNDWDADMEMPVAIEAVKSEIGPWPCPEGPEAWTRSEDGVGSNTYSALEDLSQFKLRARSYYQDSLKVPVTKAAFRLHAARNFRTVGCVFHVARRLPSLRCFLEDYPEAFFVIIVRIVPLKSGWWPNAVLETALVVTVFVRDLPVGEDPVFDNVLQIFLQGGSKTRNQRLKYVAKIQDAPSIVTRTMRALGGDRPVVLGRNYIEQTHFGGQNYIEVDVDLTSSRVAKSICATVLGASGSVTVDELFVIEGQAEEELPERALGAIRHNHVVIHETLIDISEDHLQSSDYCL